MAQYVSSSLISELDERLAEAVAAVSAGEAGKASVSLTLTVEDDEDEGLVGSYTLKGARQQKGHWRPYASQPQLPLADEPATGAAVDGGKLVGAGA